MAWRIVTQPDGFYARFADPVDSFTHVNLTREEAIDLCQDYVGRTEAVAKVDRADAEPERWKKSLDTIKLIHGVKELGAVMAEIAAGRALVPPDEALK